MSSVGYRTGDIIAIKRTPDAAEGDVVMVRIGAEITLKCFHRPGKDRVELKPCSSNPEHRPIVIDERTEDWEIVGVGRRRDDRTAATGVFQDHESPRERGTAVKRRSVHHQRESISVAWGSVRNPRTIAHGLVGVCATDSASATPAKMRCADSAHVASRHHQAPTRGILCLTRHTVFPVQLGKTLDQLRVPGDMEDVARPGSNSASNSGLPLEHRQVHVEPDHVSLGVPGELGTRMTQVPGVPGADDEHVRRLRASGEKTQQAFAAVHTSRDAL